MRRDISVNAKHSRPIWPFGFIQRTGNDECHLSGRILLDLDQCILDVAVSMTRAMTSTITSFSEAVCTRILYTDLSLRSPPDPP